MTLDHEDAYRLLRHYDIRCSEKKPHSKSIYTLRAGATPQHKRSVSLAFGDASVARESPVSQIQADGMLSELHEKHRTGVHGSKGERMLAHVIVKGSKAYEDEPGITSFELQMEVNDAHYDVFAAQIDVSRHIKVPPAPLHDSGGHEGKGYQPAGRQ